MVNVSFTMENYKAIRILSAVEMRWGSGNACLSKWSLTSNLKDEYYWAMVPHWTWDLTCPRVRPWEARHKLFCTIVPKSLSQNPYFKNSVLRMCFLFLPLYQLPLNSHARRIFHYPFVSRRISFYFFFFNFYFYFILLYNTVLVLPYIDMNPPRVYMHSRTWTPLPHPSP